MNKKNIIKQGLAKLLICLENYRLVQMLLKENIGVTLSIQISKRLNFIFSQLGVWDGVNSNKSDLTFFGTVIMFVFIKEGGLFHSRLKQEPLKKVHFQIVRI